jgi:hypothetical protein
MNFKPIIIITGGFVYVSCISNDMKTKTFEWHKYLLKNPDNAKSLIVNNTLLCNEGNSFSCRYGNQVISNY